VKQLGFLFDIFISVIRIFRYSDGIPADLRASVWAYLLTPDPTYDPDADPRAADHKASLFSPTAAPDPTFPPMPLPASQV
jgi:hypothetical protein